MQSRKKNVGNICLLLVLIACTFYILLRDQDMDEVILSIRRINPFFLILTLLLSAARIYGEAISIYILGNSLEKKKFSFWGCVKYALCGFFFCGITPSATGGQPAQVYYMKKDGITMANSSLVLVLITIIYRGTLLVFGGGILLFCYQSLYRNLGMIRFWFLLGLLVNSILVVMFCFLLFSKKIIRILMQKCIVVLSRLKLLKKEEAFAARCDAALSRYHKGAAYMGRHKRVMYEVAGINLLQRFLIFAATYSVYRGLGLSGEPVFYLVLLQSIVAICADMLPLPGGVGANEHCFVMIFRRIFERNTIAAMLLVRGFNFYLPALISAIVVCAVQMKEIRNTEKTGSEL